MMRYVPVPVFQFEDGRWSVPDSLLARCWKKIDEAKRRIVFYTGGVDTEEDFQELLHRDGIHAAVILEGDEPCFLAWLSNLSDGWGWAHFCGLNGYRRQMAEAAIEYWKRLGLIGVIGMIPETNVPALHVVRDLGWIEVGEIPRYCHLKKEGLRVGAVIVAKLLQEG